MPSDYVRYFRSNPQPTARGPVSPGLALLGGPPDGPPPEVDAAFAWLLAKSGWGRFVVIGSDGVDEYAHYLYDHLPPPYPMSVETFIFKSRDAASNPDIVASIRQADALFIQGGDQWDYIRMWKDTGVQQAMAEIIARGVPIGGSSAGLAVLGQFVFAARNGTVYSSEALADPYHEGVTLDRDLIDSPTLPPYIYLKNLITDSHFQDRQRMGRLLAFLARLAQDGWCTSARAIAVDEMTAVLVEADGSARVVDNRPADDRGAAYFLQTPGPPELCRPGQPLTYENVSVQRIGASDAGATFHLGTWQGRGGQCYRASARQGILEISQAIPAPVG